jgi:hypothetical protein
LAACIAKIDRRGAVLPSDIVGKGLPTYIRARARRGVRGFWWRVPRRSMGAAGVWHFRLRVVPSGAIVGRQALADGVRLSRSGVMREFGGTPSRRSMGAAGCGISDNVGKGLPTYVGLGGVVASVRLSRSGVMREFGGTHREDR